MNSGKYTNAAQQRVLQLLLAMFGDVVAGYTPGALAKAINTTASNITRDLDNLATAGFAEQLEETGHWRLTARVPQQAIKVFAAINAHERRLEEAKQRFTRNPD
jgi:DNA-binding IclR family transcriptional regulator